MEDRILSYTVFGSKNENPLVILHGFLGSSRNWATIAKILSEQFYVITVDLRNHGDSFHDDEHTYAAMAEDVIRLLDFLRIQKCHLLGHSMGGKVAMKVACQFGDRLHSLIVVDIAPKQYFPHRQEVKSMLALDLQQLKNRQEAEDLLQKDIPDLGLRKFLVTNLAHQEGRGFYWRVNLPVFDRESSSLGGNSLQDHEVFMGKTLFILGGKSDFVKSEDYALIFLHFSNAMIEVLADSDHNPHFSSRADFLTVLTRFLSE